MHTAAESREQRPIFGNKVVLFLANVMVVMRFQVTAMMLLPIFRSLSAFNTASGVTKRIMPRMITPQNYFIVTRKGMSTFHMNNKNEASVSASASNAIPRAAVSVVVRHESVSVNEHKNENKYFRYALVQRGKEPNKGIWSLPGGKIESGEGSLIAAKRELWEETGLGADPTINSKRNNNSINSNLIEDEEEYRWDMQWCEDAPICTTDSIHFSDESYENSSSSNILFHYVISQWFVQISSLSSKSHSQRETPKLVAADDAADAAWFDLDSIQKGIDEGKITPGVEKVIIRSELMTKKGIL